MAAKRPWEDGAGAWVAFRDEPHRVRPGATMRAFVYGHVRPGGLRSSTTTRADAMRYDTKTEAMAAARIMWPFRARGCRVGAERFEVGS